MLGLSACVKEAPKYEPAEKPSTAEVYFSSDLASNYDIAPSPSFFVVTVNRANSSEDYTASISATADPAFSVPSTVNFSAGLTGAALKIAYDPDKLVDGTKYKFELKTASEASQYGSNVYSFTATFTAPKEGSDWEPYMTSTPAFVENIMKIYSSSIDTHTFDCYVEKFNGKAIYRIVNPMSVKVVDGKKYLNPYYDESGSKDGIWPAEFLNTDDYYITLDMDGSIYAEEIGGELKPGDVYIAGSNLNFQWEDDGPFNIISCIAWPTCVDYGAGELLGKYDEAKNCIVFNDYLLCAGNSIWAWPTYAGVPTSYLYFDKTLMKEDYNEYDTQDWASGVVSSTLFGEPDNPYVFASDVKYWIDESIEEGNNCVYFLPDYFQDGKGLAFMAPDPDSLKDGDEITDVANEQEVGDVFGTNLYTNVKKGTVSIGEDGFPVFDVQIDVFATQDGVRVLDYGKFDENIAINAFVEIYTDEDVLPAESKADFLGTYTYKSNDYYYADGGIVDGSTLVVIEDAGEDEDGDWVAITGLSGYDEPDTIYGTYEDGFIYITGQMLEGKMYGFETAFAPINSKTFMYYMNESLMLGFVPNGKLALVNTPGGECNGGYFFCSQGGFSIQWNYIFEAAVEADAVAKTAPKAQLHKALSPDMRIVNRKLNVNSGAMHVENGKKASDRQPIGVR